VDDVGNGGDDHADALRYLVMGSANKVEIGKIPW
jgi:hypothetical protein